MEELRKELLKGFSKSKALKEIGCSYIGSTSSSMKTALSEKAGVLTYCIYLAPWNLSGHQVCPGGEHCSSYCLNRSGHNKVDIMAHGEGHSMIEQSRIRKTNFFYDFPEQYVRVVIAEIQAARRAAERKGLGFAVRLNGTSDISPLKYKVMTGDGCFYNILELFPDVQFYDYTKVLQRYEILKDYSNYDLTFSFDGYNWNSCREVLDKYNGRVAVVFEGHDLPEFFNGYRVIDANKYDMRYMDPQQSIMGLSYHTTANDYRSGKYQAPDTPFIIKRSDVRWNLTSTMN